MKSMISNCSPLEGGYGHKVSGTVNIPWKAIYMGENNLEGKKKFPSYWKIGLRVEVWAHCLDSKPSVTTYWLYESER